MHMVAHTVPLRAAVTFAAALLAGTTAPLQAQSTQRPVTVLGRQEAGLTRIVPFGDLSLASKAGQNILYHRVGVAVRQVCPNSDAGLASHNPSLQDCTDFAWAGARPQIRRAIDLAQSGQTLAMSIAVTGAGR
jgi:UrcA family protein